ncbi:capsular biosynthesis protein [Micromonospora rosaria]|uniref:Capsular biosynthesis protein n=1 Tax=Micromonospora rosaria TaxID=47874 RepID=A0A136PRM3_9ACTN|nr:CapA family protein [Micromonospora rosaria]KXK61101.1 capsular biosynthesis protein [Micromonospora rosaria]
MYAAAPLASRSRRRVPLVFGAVLTVLLAAGCAEPAATPLWQPPAAGGASGSPATSGPPAEAEQVISLSATGDILMGNVPNRLPANGGKGFFESVTEALEADLVMGNLEEPLTVDTGTGKCGPNSTRCFQFRAPPEYAAHLRDAGFHLLNMANNHGYDYGPKGYTNTQEALEKYDLEHTGAPDQITVVDVKGVKVAVAGFSSYVWSNSLVDIDAAEKVVKKAATLADLVVVQVHMGAEGAAMTRVKPGTEMFLGENRGDPIRFSRRMVEAGADLVVGHGPHVLRGMEFHQGRLIAYSLGNFAGGGNTLNNSGRLGWGGVLKVSLKPDGTFVEGEFVSTYMNGTGKPTMDPDDRGLGLARELTRLDFPKTGARFSDTGSITTPRPA